MKTLNLRLVIILVAGTLVLGVTAWGLNKYQKYRNAGFFLEQAARAQEQAEHAEERGDIEKELEHYFDAVEKLTWYVSLRPDDTDALQKLSLLQADLAFDRRFMQQEPRLFAWARSGLEKVSRQDPNRSDARRKLVELYMVSGRHSDASDHLKVLLKGAQEDAELRRLLGVCQAALGQNDAAVESFEEAIRAAPNEVSTYRMAVAILRDRNRLNRPADADGWMSKLVESVPDSPQTHLAYGHYLFSLARLSLLDSTTKHPILLDAMISGVLSDAVRGALEGLELADGDPDGPLLAEQQGILVDAVKRALRIYDPNLALDAPATLFFAARRGVPADTIDTAVLTKARDSVMTALEAELEPAERDALGRAASHGVLVEALKTAIDALHNRRTMFLAGRDQVLTDAIRHADKARELATADHDVLSLAEKHGVVVDAMKRALQQEDSTVLRLTAKRPLLVDAVKTAIEHLDLADDDPDRRLLAARPGIVVDTMKDVLGDRQVVSGDRGALAEDTEGGILARVVQRAAETRQSALESNDLGAILLAVQCTLGRGEFGEARKYAERGVELYPKDFRTYSALADIELQSRRPDEAVACLRRGLKAIDNDQHLVWKMADLLIDTAEIQEAQRTVARLRDLGHPPDRVGYLQARIEYARGHWLAASRGFEEVRGGLTTSPRYLKRADFYLAKCYQQLGNASKALASYRSALSVDPNYAEARAGVLDALLRQVLDLIRSKRFDEADQEFRQAEKEFRQIASQAVDPASGWLQLARILFQMNLALDEPKRSWRRVESLLEEAVRANPESIDVVVFQAQLLVTQKRMPEAEALLRRVRDANPQLLRIWRLLATLAQMQKDWDRAEAILSEAEQKLGDLVPLRLARARYLLQRYEKDAAGRLEELAKNTDKFSEKDRWQLLIGLSEVAQQQENWQQAGQLLDQAEQGLGDSVPLRLARVRLLAQRGGEGTPDRLKQLAENAEQFSPADRLRLWRSLLSLAIQMGDDEQAKRLCHRLAEEQPSDLRVRSLLFEIALRLNDQSGMDEVLKEIEQIEGKGPHWLFGQAVRLSLRAEGPADKRLDQALKYLDRAAELHPTWSRVPLMKGGVYDRKGNWDLALENYGRAIQMGARNPAAIRQYARILIQRQRFEEASAAIRLVEGQRSRHSRELDRLGYMVERQLRDLDRALEFARRAAAGSDDYALHILYGNALADKARQLQAKGNTSEAQEMLTEAEESLRHAVQLSDKVADTWIALVQFFGKTTQTAKAQEAIEQARSKIPPDEVHLALGACYASLGRFEEAQKEFRVALAAAPDDVGTVRAVGRFYVAAGKPELARPHLEAIVHHKVEARQADVMWARRELATKVLNWRGDYTSRQEAIALIKQNLAALPRSTSDLSILADMQGRDPARAQRQEAIRALETKPSLTPDEQFRLAGHYRGQGDWAKANRQMIKLLGRPGAEPRYMGAYVEWLLQRNELHDAEMWLNKLQSTVPNQFATTLLRARLLFRRERFEQALDLVKGFLDKPDAQPSSEATRMRLVASALEAFVIRLKDSGQESMAERFALEADGLYRVYARSGPGREMFLTAFLARMDRIDEALEVVERVWRDSSAHALGQTLNIILNNPSASAEQIRRTEKVVQAALEEFDKPVILLLVLAQVRTAEERYQEAEARYREVLEMEPDNEVAMNNLAVLLALQGIKLEESLKLIDRAIGISGPVAAMLDSRASVYMALDQPDKALADLEMAIAEKGTPVRLFHQAQAYLQSGKKQNALKAMQRALELGLDPEALEPPERPAYRKLKALVE